MAEQVGGPPVLLKSAEEASEELGLHCLMLAAAVRRLQQQTGEEPAQAYLHCALDGLLAIEPMLRELYADVDAHLALYEKIIDGMVQVSRQSGTLADHNHHND
ncbi:MAG: hypothetical protein M3Y13_00315 [Armatimonadota bacterium]|nr:hypothetical protein [Armatimonadota bacterium]